MFGSLEFVIIASASIIVDRVGLCGPTANFVAYRSTVSHFGQLDDSPVAGPPHFKSGGPSATVGLCYSECHPPDGRSILNPAIKFKRNDGNPNASSYFWLRKLCRRPKISMPFGNRYAKPAFSNSYP